MSPDNMSRSARSRAMNWIATTAGAAAIATVALLGFGVASTAFASPMLASQSTSAAAADHP